MKSILLLTLIGTLLIFVSCKEDEEPTPPHEVGVWVLDSYVFANLPPGFQRQEGRAFGVGDITFNGVSFEDYTLTLIKDGTYEREVGIPGPDIEDEGTWELDDDDLILESEDGSQEWSVEKNEDDDLWLGQESQFGGFLPDAFYDTLTQEYADYINSLSAQKQDSILGPITASVTLDLVYIFERD